MLSKFVVGAYGTTQTLVIDEPCSMASIRSAVPAKLPTQEHLNIVHNQDAQFERCSSLMQGQYYNYQINSNGGKPVSFPVQEGQAMSNAFESRRPTMPGDKPKVVQIYATGPVKKTPDYL